jgi:hypothetical protein
LASQGIVYAAASTEEATARTLQISEIVAIDEAETKHCVVPFADVEEVLSAATTRAGPATLLAEVPESSRIEGECVATRASPLPNEQAVVAAEASARKGIPRVTPHRLLPMEPKLVAHEKKATQGHESVVLLL